MAKINTKVRFMRDIGFTGVNSAEDLAQYHDFDKCWDYLINSELTDVNKSEKVVLNKAYILGESLSSIAREFDIEIYHVKVIMARFCRDIRIHGLHKVFVVGVDGMSDIEVHTNDNIKNKKFNLVDIGCLGFSTRLENSLYRSGIRTVADLQGKGYGDICRIRNIGSKSLKELFSKLIEIGFYSDVSQLSIRFLDIPEVDTLKLFNAGFETLGDIQYGVSSGSELVKRVGISSQTLKEIVNQFSYFNIELENDTPNEYEDNYNVAVLTRDCWVIKSKTNSLEKKVNFDDLPCYSIKSFVLGYARCLMK